MKYTAKYFSDNMPAWKKKKDSFLTRLLYRPISFFLASIAANLGISANTVSYSSAVVALAACAMFLVNNYCAHIVGAVLMIVWIIMDCVDGNLARGVKKLPFGEFADSMSSYMLVGFMCTTMGFAVYNGGGLFFKAGNPWIMLLGALASSSDTMMRLIYQKYKSNERKLADQGIIEVEKDFRSEGEQPTSLKTIIENIFGGLIKTMILLASIFNALDVVVIYCFLFFGASFVVNTLIYVRKAMVISKNYDKEKNA